MSGLYPRLSPNAQHDARGHDRIVIDGRDTGLLGTTPVWADDETVFYTRQPDGAAMRISRRTLLPIVAREAGGNPPIAAALGSWAIQRFDPPRTIASDGEVLTGRVSPQLIANSLWRSTLSQTDNSLGVDARDTELQTIDPGHIVWHRWSNQGTTLVWQRVNGTMAGIVDWANPQARAVVELGQGFKPVPVWTGRELMVLYHTEDRLLLSEWGRPIGYVLETGFNGGSAYTHDAGAVSQSVIRVLYHDAAGNPRETLKLLVDPRVSLTPPVVVPPPVDPFAFVPDGTLVESAVKLLVGQDVPDGTVICIHKNGTHPNDQHEWRKVVRPRILHWGDASRFPGDKGWYNTPITACEWARTTFLSGERFGPFEGHIVDLNHPNDEPTFWRHRYRMFATVGGGVCVEVDPRPFDALYGKGWKYERHYNLPDGRVRFEEWFTPAAGQADVRLRQIDDVAHPGTPAPFVPSFRPEEDDMQAPGVDVTFYDKTLMRGAPWVVVLTDRNNPGVNATIALRPLSDGNVSVHGTLTNPAGSDTSGAVRKVEVKW